MSFRNLALLEENNLVFQATIDSVFELLNSDQKSVLVTDDIVYPLYRPYLDQLKIDIFILPTGEQSKTLSSVEKLTDFMFQNNLNRKSRLIGFGGGVVTDLTGFAASIFMRGIDFTLIPTSLLAMADAAVGGKTGVNNSYGKNQLGVIRDAKQIIICTQFLKTLDKRNFLNGMAEIIKIAAIFDKKLFKIVEECSYPIQDQDLYHIVMDAVLLKQSIVSRDKFEQGERALLNYGHTIGHAIESTTSLLHGECVSIGMVLANKLSGQNKATKRVLKTLQKYELPTSLPDCSHQQLIHYLKHDKKATNTLNFIFMTEIGKGTIQPVDMSRVVDLLSNKVGIYLGEIKEDVPEIHGSKSITNRVLLLSALANGVTTISNFTESEDTEAMLDSLIKLGLCEIIEQSGNELVLMGCAGQLHDQQTTIDVKESGTSARFLLPICALMNGVIMKSAKRMEQRPISELIDALQLQVKYLNKEKHFPLQIIGNPKLHTVTIDSSVSSQFVSALLMAAPLIGMTIIYSNDTPSWPFIDMTLKLMRQFRIEIEHKDNTFTIKKQSFKSLDKIIIEHDVTGLSYDALYYAFHNQTLKIESVLQGDIKFQAAIEQPGPVDFDCIDCSDTFITIAVCKACTKGVTRLRGIENQRVKECDRVMAVCQNLIKLGIVAYYHGQVLTINGIEITPSSHYTNVVIETQNDHRIAMAFTILAAYLEEKQYRYRIIIDNRHCVNKTFPNFYEHIKKFGIYTHVPIQNPFNEKYFHLKEPIFIIGMRGAGKTTLSKQLALDLQFKYVSIDEMIKSSIKDLKEFREEERECLIKVIEQEHYNCIIDCGGGIIEHNQDLLKFKCTIYIDKHIEELLKDQENKAPMDVYQVYSHRKPIYECLAKYTFIVPEFKTVSLKSRNISKDRYYKQVHRMFTEFVKKITHLSYPLNKNYACDTSFVCLHYADAVNLTEKDFDFINRNHNMMEIRLDEHDNYVNYNIQAIRYFLTIPLILTFRTSQQGGSYLRQDQRIFQKIFIQDYHDVELDQFRPTEFENQIILSYHFLQQQQKESIPKIIQKMLQIYQDNKEQIAFLKVVIHQNITEHIDQYHKCFESDQVIPYLLLSMGPNKLLRIQNDFMIPLCYNAPTAPGQINVQELRAVRALCHMNTSQNYHIFGTDLSTSRSDLYHQQQFNALNAQHSKYYTKVQIKEVDEMLPYIQHRNFAGASITMPFKEAVKKYCTELSPEVHQIGVMNTLIKYRDKFIGFNTDWWGIYNPLRQYIHKSGLTCLILGAGGTAKTAVFVANLFAMKVYIHARNPEKMLQFSIDHKVKICIDMRYDVVISTVPPNSDIVLPREYIDERTIVFVAHQKDDPLLERGIGISGRCMFEEQAIGQIRLFNGK